MMKKKGPHDNQADTSQLTTESWAYPKDQDVTQPSYHDEAFSVNTSGLQKTITDTRASSHMFGSKSAFKDIKSITPTQIGVASKYGEIWASEKGLVEINSLSLTNVLYSDELTGNIIIIGQLCDVGYSAVFHKQHRYIID